MLAKLLAAGLHKHKHGQILQTVAIIVAQAIPRIPTIKHFCLGGDCRAYERPTTGLAARGRKSGISLTRVFLLRSPGQSALKGARTPCVRGARRTLKNHETPFESSAARKCWRASVSVCVGNG